ncbi:MAG: hypothetical protein AB8F65_14040 [Woeseiaceae bacterium]
MANPQEYQLLEALTENDDAKCQAGRRMQMARASGLLLWWIGLTGHGRGLLSGFVLGYLMQKLRAVDMSESVL